MRNDKRFIEKTDVLREYFRSGKVFTGLETLRKMLGYANRMGVKLFLDRLVVLKLLTYKDRSYLPTEKLIGYPLYDAVRAGLPFTPQNEPADTLSLDAYMINHPASTYMVRIKGNSMEDAGIREGDIAIVDRSLPLSNGCIVIASIEGDVTIKYYQKDKNGTVLLVPANEAYHPIVLTSETEFLGVVTGTIRKYK